MAEALRVKNKYGHYLVVKEPLEFEEAKAVSKSLGGNLVQFESQQESDLLWEVISSDGVTESFIPNWSSTTSSDGGDIPYLWIGGDDKDTESSRSSKIWNWQWLSSGQEISRDRSEWGKGFIGSEPDNYLGDQNRLALGLRDWPLNNPGAFGYAGQWNDLNAKNNLWFIVEIPREFDINSERKYVSEGDIVKIDVQTAGVFDGAILYWEILGEGIDSNDFSDSDLIGSGLIKEDKFNILLPLVANFDEFEEVMEVRLFADNARQILLDSEKIIIQDSLSSLLDESNISISNEEFIELLFNNVVGYKPDSETLSFWQDKLEIESQSRESVIDQFENSPEYDVHKLIDLRTADIEIGSGIQAKKDHTVLVKYTGKLSNGEQFDTGSIEFTLGENQVIDGWEQGIKGMKAGGIRYLVIPPRLGYGNREKALIPANSTLVFETELLSITNYKLDGLFKDYKFYQKDNNRYEIKTSEGFDEITGISNLEFSDKKTINVEKDIKGTFDQVTGMSNASGQMFRLYNAAFARFPDPEGLAYWINNYSSGIDDIRAVATSFLISDEFKSAYGDNVTNGEYVQLLYKNVLNRELDQDGYDYWVGNLDQAIETRYEVLIGFSESNENKLIFSEMTELT